MKKSEDVDQARRRVKRRFNWAKALVKPQTFRFLVALGEAITPLVELILELIKFFGS